MNGKMRNGARSLSVGGPSNLLPHSPDKLIIDFGKFKKSIPLIVGTTRNDGSYIASGNYFMIISFLLLQDKNIYLFIGSIECSCLRFISRMGSA